METKSSLSQYGIIDLHLHLDGSLSPEWIIQQATLQNIILPETTPQKLLSHISVSADCTDLNEYLRCFAIPLSILQTPESLASAVEDLLVRLDQQGMIYAEIRFAPQLHTQKMMTQAEAIEAALKGLKSGLAKTSLFKANLILCCMRGDRNQAENLETIRLAKAYLTKEEAGVVAVDIAGAEALFPTANFSVEFNLAKELGVPFTIHAGEAAGAESVKQALDFGANRIGHGVRAIESESLMLQLSRQKTPLEMCPCSNLQTKTVKNLADYPLRTFLQREICATLNSDNMTVSQTSAKNEFTLLETEYALSVLEAKKLLENSIQATFLSENEKVKLREEILKRYPTLL